MSLLKIKGYQGKKTAERAGLSELAFKHFRKRGALGKACGRGDIFQESQNKE